MPEEELGESGLLRKVDSIIDQLEILAGTLEKGFPNATVSSLHLNMHNISTTLPLYQDIKSNLKGILVTLHNDLKDLGEHHLSNIISARVKLKDILEHLRDSLAAKEYYGKVKVGKLQEIIRRL